MISFSIDKQRDKVNAEWMSRPVGLSQPLVLVLTSMEQSPIFAYRLKRKLLSGPIIGEAYNCNVPKLTLRITDSRQMFIYGIGLDKQQGFTLNIGIDKNSNKGKQLREKLDRCNSLPDFKTFEDKTSMIYFKDFRQEIELLEKAIHDILDKVDNTSSGQSYQLTANRTDGNYTME